MSLYEQKTPASRFAAYLIDHPFQSLLCGIFLAMLLIPGIMYLKTNFTYRIWFRESDPLLARFDAFERRFGNDEMTAIIVHSPSGVFDRDSVVFLQNLTEDLWQVPEIIRVDSLTNYNWTHAVGDDLIVEPLLGEEETELTPEFLAERKAVALGHEVIPGYLVSSDGTAAVIYAQLKPAIGGAPDFDKVIRETRLTFQKYAPGAIDPLGGEIYPGPGDHKLYITGPSAVSYTFREVTQADLKIMVPVLMGTIVFFLLISFRRISGILLPFLVIIMSISMTLGAAGWLDIHFNNLTAIVPHILIAICVADAVHILVTFFQFRGSGLDPREATHKTLIKNLQPTLLTSISTAIGFFSFASAKLVPIVYMGILAGTGTLIAWFITIFMLTPILAYTPIRVPFRQSLAKHDQPHPLAIRYAQWLQRRRLPMITFFAIAIAFAAFIGLQNEINSNPFKYFAPSVHTRIANEFAEEKIGGMLGFEITIDSGRTDGIKDPDFLDRVTQFQNWLETLSHITKTVAVTDIIKQTNRALNGEDPDAYVIPENQELIAQELFLYTMSLPQGMDLNNRMTLDNDMIRLTAMSDLHDSKKCLDEFARIEAKAAEMGLDAHITGKLPLYQNMNPYVVSAFFTSISMALILLSLLMILVFRSWRLGLLSMIPNTVPLIFGGAFMMLLGKSLDIGTVLVASTCLGIAVDDTIHFLSNYNRWRKLGSSPVIAVAHVITHTGPALLVTTMILVVGFASFVFASFVPNVNFGILTAIVLSTALITDGTLLPAILLGARAESATQALTEEEVAA